MPYGVMTHSLAVWFQKIRDGSKFPYVASRIPPNLPGFYSTTEAKRSSVLVMFTT